MKAFQYIFVTLFSLLSSSISYGEQSPLQTVPNLSGTPWAQWKVPPGTELLTARDQQGKIKNTLKLPGGVTMVQTNFGMTGVDNSGKGAVLCTQMLNIELRQQLEDCPEPHSVATNLKEAYFWYSLVPQSDPNYREAANGLHRIKSQLTAEEIGELDKRRSKWEPVVTPADTTKSAEQVKAEQRFGNVVEKLSLPEKAKKGDAMAQMELGLEYEAGFDKPKDMVEAEKWLLKSAAQGNAVAQFKLGSIYQHGSGPLTDDELKIQLDDAIRRTNEFILANSPTPVTREQLENQARLHGKSPPRGCNETARYMINAIKNLPPGKFQSSIDDLLSIPRVPVANPCL